MKVIDRYIGSQVLMTSAFAVGVLSIVLVLGNIFKKLLDLLVNHDVPLDFIFSFIGYVLPFSLSFTIPWGFLTAVLLTFGKLSAESELTALRASGVSVFRVAIPVLLLALVFSGICMWINVDVAPRAHERMRTALFDIATSNPIALFGSDQVIDEFPGRKIYVGKKEGSQLENLLIFELNEKNVPVRVVHAQRGELQADSLEAGAELDPDNHEIRLKLYDARYEQRDEENPRRYHLTQHGITMEEGVIAISLKELYEQNRQRRGLSSMTVKELSRMSAEKSSEEELSAARTEVNKRYSFSLACIAFALIAIPLGITAQRRETSIGFAISLAIAFIYFLFIIIADTFRENPAAKPEILVWVPNILFIGLGIVLFRKLMKK